MDDTFPSRIDSITIFIKLSDTYTTNFTSIKNKNFNKFKHLSSYKVDNFFWEFLVLPKSIVCIGFRDMLSEVWYPALSFWTFINITYQSFFCYNFFKIILQIVNLFYSFTKLFCWALNVNEYSFYKFILKKNRQKFKVPLIKTVPYHCNLISFLNMTLTLAWHSKKVYTAYFDELSTEAGWFQGKKNFSWRPPLNHLPVTTYFIWRPPLNYSFLYETKIG